jgi:hypothetical protein
LRGPRTRIRHVDHVCLHQHVDRDRDDGCSRSATHQHDGDLDAAVDQHDHRHHHDVVELDDDDVAAGKPGAWRLTAVALRPLKPALPQAVTADPLFTPGVPACGRLCP